MAARRRRSTKKKTGSRRRRRTSVVSARSLNELIKRLKAGVTSKRRRRRTSKGKGKRKGASPRTTPITRRRKVRARRKASKL